MCANWRPIPLCGWEVVLAVDLCGLPASIYIAQVPSGILNYDSINKRMSIKWGCKFSWISAPIPFHKTHHIALPKHQLQCAHIPTATPCPMTRRIWLQSITVHPLRLGPMASGQMVNTRENNNDGIRMPHGLRISSATSPTSASSRAH